MVTMNFMMPLPGVETSSLRDVLQGNTNGYNCYNAKVGQNYYIEIRPSISENKELRSREKGILEN